MKNNITPSFDNYDDAIDWAFNDAKHKLKMGLQKKNIEDIDCEASEAAKRAVDNFLQEWKTKTGGNEYGEPLYCGFAWVDVYVSRTNSKEAKLLKSIGFEKSYYKPKVMTKWNPASYEGQSLDCKEVGADAYTKVLKQYGFDAFTGSRAD